MTHKYVSEGLGCANCGCMIEAEARKKAGLFNFDLAQIIAGAAVFAAGLTAPFAPEAALITFFASYALLGWRVVCKALCGITRGRIFDENFLMTLATAGAFIIGEAPEAAAVMLFYRVGEYFQNLAVKKSKKSITDLMDIRPDSAVVEQDGELITAAPHAVNIGDVIIVKPGEKIPLDGVILNGRSTLDTKALTGESLPRSVQPGDEALSGCINQSGVLRMRVQKTFKQSTVSKIIDLVENAAGKKAPTENFITTFARYYTPAVVLIAALLAVLPPLLSGAAWSEWIHRGLIFLVISCPCALVISIPLGFFGGIGGASRKGVLVKGGNYLEALSKLTAVVVDKTGTLTKGVFQVTETLPANGRAQASLLKLAAHAEAFSNHPIALSIQKAYSGDIDKKIITEYTEIPGQGISVTIDGQRVLAGSGALMQSNGIAFTEHTGIGTKLYLAADGAYAGCMTISDEVKADSKAAVSGLRALGVKKIVMLTGDNAQIAKAVAEDLGLDEAYAELLPADKVEKLEHLQDKNQKGKLAFVGDGINDAPVLARADVGIAMGGLGSDAAIEAADVVLMTDEPSRLIDAVEIARFTKKIVWQNIFFALGTKGVFLALGAFGAATMWEAVFADVGVTLVAVINAMRVIRK
jgi:Cd2+/Zn2+-exporting ATPase